MADLSIWWPSHAVAILPDQAAVVRFFTSQVKRLVQGHLSYGRPHREKRYMTRAAKELAAYRRTGNREHLINLANYAFLEDQAPENRKYHWNAEAESVTRGKGLLDWAGTPGGLMGQTKEGA